MGTYRDHMGYVQRSHGVCTEITWGMYTDYMGYIQRSRWVHTEITLGAYRNPKIPSMELPSFISLTAFLGVQ